MTTHQAFLASNHETILSGLTPSEPPGDVGGGADTRSSPEPLPAPASSGPDRGPDALVFTVDELEVLRLLADGQGEGHIAEQLGLTLAAAQIHVANIYFKVHTSTREPEFQNARLQR
jgi:DNA-binding NarL/FixJ family response regulator